MASFSLVVSLFSISVLGYGIRKPSVQLNDRNVTIISILDKTSTQSCLLKIHSIVESAENSKGIEFKFLVVDSPNFSISLWNSLFHHLFPDNKFETKSFESQSLSTISSFLRNDHFEKPVIFARFYLALLFPDLSRFIYLDNDIIVTMEVKDLYVHTLDHSCDPRIFHSSDRNEKNGPKSIVMPSGRNLIHTAANSNHHSEKISPFHAGTENIASIIQ